MLNKSGDEYDVKRDLSKTVDFEVANLQVAKEHRKSSECRQDDKSRFPICATNIEEIGQFGIGLQLYFRMIKALSIVFLIMSLISAASLYSNIEGNYFDGDEGVSFLSMTIIANQNTFNNKGSSVSDEQGNMEDRDIYRQMVIFSDLGYSLAFFLFLIIMKIMTKKETRKIKQDNVQISDYAIEVRGFPQSDKEITTSSVKKHFEDNFGKVVEVYLARKYSGVLSYYKSEEKVNKKIKEEEARVFLSKGQRSQAQLDKLKAKQEKIHSKINKKIKTLKQHDELPPLRAYVVFEEVQSRQRALRVYRKLNLCICRSWPSEYKLIDKYKIRARVPPEPSNIKWENIEHSRLSRCCRSLFGAAVVLILLVISAALIYILKNINSDQATKETCLAYEGEILTLTELQAITDTTELNCQCRNIGIGTVAQNSEYRSACWDYVLNYSYSVSLQIGVSLGIAITNVILQVIMRKLAKFVRYASKTSEMRAAMTNLFVAITLNTGFIILLINANLAGMSWWEQIVQKAPSVGDYIFNGDFTDTSRDWYVKVGLPIVTIIVINFISLLLWAILKGPIAACKRCCCWRGKILQMDLNKLFEGPSFDISMKYAKLLSVILICLFYCGGMPVLIALLFLYVFFQYWTDKYLLFRVTKKPPQFDEEMNERLFTILPWILLIHLAFSAWCYTVNDIFPETLVSSSKTKRNGSIVSIIVGKQRTLYNRLSTAPGYYFIALIAGIIVFYVVKNFFKVLCCCCIKNQDNDVNIAQSSYSNELQKLKRRSNTHYTPFKNDEYKHLLRAIDKAVVKIRRKGGVGDSLQHVFEKVVD